jgi:hypothetical protein
LATSIRKIALYFETLWAHGYPPCAAYDALRMGPAARLALVDAFPLIPPCAKHSLFLVRANIARCRDGACIRAIRWSSCIPRPAPRAA